MLDISLHYVDGIEELWLAAYNGDVPKLQQLLANDDFKSRINHTLNLGHDHSPLFFACYGAGNAAAVRELIEAGADPFQRDDMGRLPLHYAANSLLKEVIDVLLDVPNMRTHRLDDLSINGLTPLQALFLPSLGISQAIKTDNSKLAKCLDSMLDPNRDASKRAMEKVDKNGLSSFMLVKHYKLAPWFPPQHTPPKMFENFLRCFVTVPANITELLASDLYCPIQPQEPISLETRIALFGAAHRVKLENVLIFTASDQVQDQQEQDKSNVIDVIKNEFKAFTP
jgi:hypothetical protein